MFILYDGIKIFLLEPMGPDMLKLIQKCVVN